MKADAVVIGAGVAGLSAAVRLADAGWRVVVVEEAPRLGGRATAFTDRTTGERVDNGQHVLFGCYRETFAFLRAIGAAHLAPPATRLAVTMVDPHGASHDLTCPRLPPPWHLVAGVLRWPAVGLADRAGVVHLRRLLADVRRAGAAAAALQVDSSWTVDRWLRAHRQSERLCDWLWRPLAIAALNQPPDTAAARPFVRVLGELFGPRVEDSALALPRVPLDDLFGEPARRHLEQRGGHVLTKTSARVEVDSDGRRVLAVRAGGASIDTPVVVSSVPWHALAGLWPGGVPVGLRPIADAAGRMASSPIVTANLWFDGPGVLPRPFVGFVGGPMHWAFDRRGIVGGESAHLSLVASGAADIVRLDNATIAGRAVGHLTSVYPSLLRRRLVHAVVVRETRATFSLAPGQPVRPPAETPLAGFVLAGDWTDTGLPATIESAALSGHRAADIVLAGGRR